MPRCNTPLVYLLLHIRFHLLTRLVTILTSFSYTNLKMRMVIEVDDRGLHQLQCSFRTKNWRIFKDPEPVVILFWKRKFKPKRVVRGFIDLENFQKPGINQRL